MELTTNIKGVEVTIKGELSEIQNFLERLGKDEPLWPAAGKYIPISSMTTEHLMNAIAYCYRLKLGSLREATANGDIDGFLKVLASTAGNEILEKFPLTSLSGLVMELHKRAPIDAEKEYPKAGYESNDADDYNNDDDGDYLEEFF